MASENEPSKVPPLLVEKLALGELSPKEAEEVRRRLEEAGELHRLAALKAEDRRILEELPPERVVPALEAAARARDEGSRRQVFPVRWLVPAFLAAATAVLVVSVRPEGVREKGIRPHLVVHRQTASGAERLAPGDLALPGDVLQLGYVASGARYGVILSVDGRGVVTLHLPAEGDRAAALEEGATPLEHAYALDDAPLFERFFLVTSEAPFEVGPVHAAAKALARDPAGAREQPLALEAGLAQASFLVRKPPPQ